MDSLLLYLSMMLIGSFVGSRFMSDKKEYRWIGNLQFAAIIILVFTMGTRIGSDDRVIKSLGNIGIYAFVITIFAMTGSILFIFLARKWLRIDKKGIKRND